MPPPQDCVTAAKAAVLARLALTAAWDAYVTAVPPCDKATFNTLLAEFVDHVTALGEAGGSAFGLAGGVTLFVNRVPTDAALGFAKAYAVTVDDLAARLVTFPRPADMPGTDDQTTLTHHCLEASRCLPLLGADAVERILYGDRADSVCTWNDLFDAVNRATDVVADLVVAGATGRLTAGVPEAVMVGARISWLTRVVDVDGNPGDPAVGWTDAERAAVAATDRVRLLLGF